MISPNSLGISFRCGNVDLPADVFRILLREQERVPQKDLAFDVREVGVRVIFEVKDGVEHDGNDLLFFVGESDVHEYWFSVMS